MIRKAVLLIFISVEVAKANNDNLIATVQIFRHGQRTPFSFYPTDPYKNLDTYWEGLDYGQLTNEGKRQQFALGKFTRRRYSDWLPSTYSHKIIYAQTTDMDRTHMSAQSNLYGLFPASGKDVWHHNVDWQPIPIHPSDKRIVFDFNYPCPLFYNLLANISTQREYIDLDLTYASMYKYISSNSGFTLTSFNEAATLYDTLYIEEQVGYALPSWTNSIYPEPFGSLSAKASETFTYNTPMKRLFTGLFLYTVMEYFEKIIEDPTSLPKYQMYSAHDVHLFSILNSLGLKPTKPIPFTASLWFEIRKVQSIDVVNLWMKSDDEFTQLSIQGCSLNCPLNEVKSLLSDILIDINTWKKECESTV